MPNVPPVQTSVKLVDGDTPTQEMQDILEDLLRQEIVVVDCEGTPTIHVSLGVLCHMCMHTCVCVLGASFLWRLVLSLPVV